MKTKTALDKYKETNFNSLDVESQKEVLENVLNMYKSGKTIKEIGVELGKSHCAIHNLLKKIKGFTPRPAGQKPRGGDDAVLKRYKSGKTMVEIAGELGKSHSTIHKILHRTEGFTPRSSIKRTEQRYDESINTSNTNIPNTVFICPYCWEITGVCCPNDDYLKLSGYIYKSFLESDNETRKQIIESEQNKKNQSLKEQSNIIRQLGRY